MTVSLSTTNGLKVKDEFILIKDLPHIKAGEIFVVKDCYNSDELYLMAVNKESIKISDITNCWEWFKKKEEVNWKPKVGETFHYIPEEGNIGKSIRPNKDKDRGFAKMWFNAQFEFGNVFETQADAEFCRDEFIKKAFNKYHEEYPTGSPRS